MSPRMTITEGVDAAPAPGSGAGESTQELLERVALGTLAVAGADVAGPALASLSSSDFVAPRHAAALDAIVALRERGEPVTPASLAAEMSRRGAPASYRTAAAVERLLGGADPESALDGHLRALREATARRAAKAALHAGARGVESGAAADELAGQMEVALDRVRGAMQWPEPIPLGTQAVPSWPRGVLPGALAAMAQAVSTSCQVPLDMAAMLGMGAVSAAIGGRVQVVIGDWVEPTNLYLAVAMPPASRKSATVREMTAPILDWEETQRGRLGLQAEESAAALRIAESIQRRAEDAAARAKDDAGRADAEEQLRAAVADVATARARLVRAPRVITKDATPEALTTLLYEHEGRMALISAEGGDIFEMAAGRYSKGPPNLGVYLEAHAGDPIRVDRKGRTPEFVRRPALTIAVATQPSTLRTLSSPEIRDRGLPARFLFSVPASNIGERDVDPPGVDSVTSGRWRSLLHGLLDAASPVDDSGAARPHALVLSSDASAVFRAYRGRVEAALRRGEPLHEMPDWGGKLAGAVARIAAVFHAVEHDSVDGTPWQIPISADTISRAIRLADEYLIPHARLAYQVMGDAPGVDSARRLLDWIRRTGRPTFAARDAHRALDRSGSREDVVDPALRVLEAHGWIRPVEQVERRPGRPSERYHVHPDALTR